MKQLPIPYRVFDSFPGLAQRRDGFRPGRDAGCRQVSSGGPDPAAGPLSYNPQNEMLGKL